MSGTTSLSATSAAGNFQVENGQIIDPNGNTFVAKGINVFDSQMGNASQILSDFPGINFIRLNVYSYQSPSAYASFVQQMTAAGVVVEFEDHTTSTGSNSGGGEGSAFGGSQLSNELNWYSSMASAYASNPYVWFGTDNEPPPGGLSNWEQETYNAIRGSGNNNMVLIETPGGGYPAGNQQTYGLDQSVYSGMYNIAIDDHYYGWASNYNTDQNAVNSALNSIVQSTQAITSENGTLPVIIGETGDSMNAWSTAANASQVAQAVQQAANDGETSGAVAWGWDPGDVNNLTDGQGNLTSDGQEWAQWIASNSRATASTAQINTTTNANNSSPLPASAVSQSDVSAATSGGNQQFITGNNQTVDVSSGNTTVTDSGSGNTYLLPAAGNGAVEFTSDILNSGDTLNLTAALAATDWNGSTSTLSSYVTVSDTSQAATVSVSSTAGGQGTTIATIDGATGLDLNSLLSSAIT